MQAQVKGCQRLHTLEEPRDAHFLSPQRRESWSYPDVGPLPPGTHDGFQSFLSHPVCGNFLQKSGVGFLSVCCENALLPLANKKDVWLMD